MADPGQIRDERELTVQQIMVFRRGTPSEDVLVSMYPDELTARPVHVMSLGPLVTARCKAQVHADPLIRRLLVDVFERDPELVNQHLNLRYRAVTEELS